MGYRGKTFQIPCSKGGFNYNENTDMIDPTMFVSPSKNINLHRNGRSKRGGTAKVNETAVSSSPRIVGLFDFKLTGSSFQVFATADGKLWQNSTTTIKTGLSTANKFAFEVFGNELYVCDGDTTPQTWDGAAAGTSNLTTPPSDWTGSEQPIQMIAHGRQASRRMWAIYSNAVYYSALGDGKDFSTASGGGKIPINTGDAVGLVGGVEFGDRLIVFSRDKAFIIDDSAFDTANWGYSPAQWNGGVPHWRLIVKVPNDIICMSEDGDIYSVVAAEGNPYGDYKQASLARPAFIDNWIRENLKLSSIDDFHAVYDPILRAIKFFVVRTGQTEVDTALVYFIDRPVDEAWVIHDNQNSASGYNASCSALVRTAVGAYSVYTGDYDGFLWKLEQTTKSDAGSAYYGGFKTPSLTFDNPRVRKHYRRGYVIAKTQGNYNLSVNVWIDGVAQTATTVSLSGSGGVLDTDLLDSFVLGGTEFIDRYFDLGYYGRRIQLEFYNNGAGQDFFVSQILIDHKTLGALP